ncbi:serine hydrolase, partial [Streptomyces boncukensis]
GCSGRPGEQPLAWEGLLRRYVLDPLGLHETALRPSGTAATDAVGHRKDGRTPVPALEMGGFAPAGAVRATPGDLLRYLEAQLRLGGAAAAGAGLGDALALVQRPVLRRGHRHAHTHSIGWFVQEGASGGPMWFHGGATCGQQVFLGFRPSAGTALAAVCTRRFRLADAFSGTAHALLADAG